MAWEQSWRRPLVCRLVLAGLTVFSLLLGAVGREVTTYVDGLGGSDHFDGLSLDVVGEQGPKRTIQAALDAVAAAAPEVTPHVIVLPGRYAERVCFPPRDVILSSADPDDPEIVAATCLAGAAGADSPLPLALLFSGATGPGTIVRGFTVRTGTGRAIECRDGAAPTLRGNVICANPAGALLSIDSRPTLNACVVYGNGPVDAAGTVCCIGGELRLLGCTLTGNVGATSVTCQDSRLTVRNAILWDARTTSDEPGLQIDCRGGSVAQVTYSCIAGAHRGVAGQVSLGQGVMGVDPQFADLASGDVHLRSQGGRWTAAGWLADASTSPCIDAADPESDVATEPQPHGGRANLGAYGGTAQASHPAAVSAAPAAAALSVARVAGSRASVSFPAALLRGAGRLIAAWPLNEDLNDLSANGLHLRPEGHARIAAGSLALTGAGWVQRSGLAPELFPASGWTLSFWFRAGDRGPIFSAWDAVRSRASLRVTLAADGAVEVQAWGRGLLRQWTNASVRAVAAGPGWHQALLAWRPTTGLTLYLDGTLSCSSVALSVGATLLQPARLDRLRLGAESGPAEWDAPYVGSLATVLCFGEWLDEAAARELFALGLGWDPGELLRADADADGLPDCWEEAWLETREMTGSDDPDGDGLDNAAEQVRGCDPLKADSDGDGLDDGDEVTVHHTDPLKADSDGDGLDDGDEVTVHHTDPLVADSDGDGLGDGCEVAAELDPLQADSDGNGTLDACEDPDQDGLTNAEEQSRETPLTIPDVGNAVVSFASGVTRVDEAAGELLIELTLSDLPAFRGQVSVAVERRGGSADPDADARFETQTVIFSAARRVGAVRLRVLSDLQREPTESVVLELTRPQGASLGEITRHTIFISNVLATADDSDGDGLPDAWERLYFGSLEPNGAGDFDGDGLTNLEEYCDGGRPDRPYRLADPGELKLRVTGVVP